jgi:ferredoxin
MIFRVFEKEELKKLVELLIAHNRVVGPVEAGKDSSGIPIYAFGEIFEFKDLRLNYTTTKLSAKKYFLPFKEELATFRMDTMNWQKEINYNVKSPLILFGLHPCDINALNKLDKVLIHSDYPMPYYLAKRKNTFIVGVNCEPQPSCFCRSMGTDTAMHGFDLFITDLGNRYFAEIHTDTAYNFLKHIKTTEPCEDDHVRYMKIVSERNKKFVTYVDTTDLMKILDMEFQSEVWKHWGDRCLACGTCSSVCPTCYCYGVEESVDIDLKRARKLKMLYSCNLIDFAEVAGGHNFRPERSTRLKYRYYHKHRGFVEAFEESLCVGCGRCGEACLAEIRVPDVINSVRSNGVRV